MLRKPREGRGIHGERAPPRTESPFLAIILRTHSVIAGSPLRPPSYASLTVDESTLSLRKYSAFDFHRSTLFTPNADGQAIALRAYQGSEHEDRVSEGLLRGCCQSDA